MKLASTRLAEDVEESLEVNRSPGTGASFDHIQRLRLTLIIREGQVEPCYIKFSENAYVPTKYHCFNKTNIPV